MLSGFQNGSSICLDFVDSAFTLLGAKLGYLTPKDYLVGLSHI